jgi:hypothetical protein
VHFELVATPAKRTVEISFDGMPKLEELQQFARTNASERPPK